MPWLSKATAVLATAASIAIVYVGVTSFTGKALAFEDIAKALDGLRSATFDVITEIADEDGKQSALAKGKGYFLAPSRQRIEISVDISSEPAIKAAAAAAERNQPGDEQAGKTAANAMSQAMAQIRLPKMTQITIVDSQADKAVMLMPTMKIASVMNMKKINEDKRKSAVGAPPDLFELVRRIVREGGSGTGEEIKPLGKKVIDGQEAVGFGIQNAMNGMGDLTLWADPETARPIRIEVAGELFGKLRMAMSNFQFDVPLDPSLFNLEPPADYVIQTVEVTTPTEEDLLLTLRTVAEHNQGLFPQELSMNKEIMEAVMAGHKLTMPAMDQNAQEKMEAAMNKIAAKYGGKEAMQKKFGGKLPPGIQAELMRAIMPLSLEQSQKQMREQMRRQVQEQKQVADELHGLSFYMALKSENDPHYTGKNVKLGTPDTPILWYKPTGADKYRVIYADLTIKEVPADKVPKATPSYTKQ